MISRPRWLRWERVLAALFGIPAAPLFMSGADAAAVTMLLISGALLTQKDRPWHMSALALASGAVQVVSGTVLYPVAWVYFLLAKRLGTDPDERLRRWGLICCGAASLASGVDFVTGLSSSFAPHVEQSSPLVLFYGGALYTLPAAGVAFGGWATGYAKLQKDIAVQARIDAVEQRRLADLYHQEQTRRRIAADMHDIVGHSWAVVAAQADGARYRLHEAPDEAEQALKVIADTARQSMDEVRSLLEDLRAGDSGERPLTGGRHQLFTCMRESGMRLEHTETGTVLDHPLIAVTAERLLTESLTNALKYGELTEPVEVTETWGNGYRLTVTNVVRTQDDPTHQGHGLDGMAERVRLLGGTFRAGRIHHRWQVEITLPVTQGEPG
ncbi:sensor histidine kinase [Austwickia chelonae]|uniref:sensor histidine kinase n=1 Tax=Austwickia chelonae TaxID=100225 RepID=UPI000E2796E6|nr:histidine kinase [Austwickia chelonae]